MPDHGQAPSELSIKLSSGNTPQIISNVVEDIEKIVRAIRIDGWQSTYAGQRQSHKVLRQTPLKYELHKEQELFGKVYGVYKGTLLENRAVF